MTVWLEAGIVVALLTALTAALVYLTRERER